MNFIRRATRLILLAALAIVILTISAAVANEFFSGTTSRIYQFMHRVPYEQDGHGTDYEIGRVNIVHRSRLIRPLESIRFAVEGEEPVALIGPGSTAGEPSATVRSMIDTRYPQVPPEIRDAWSESVAGLVRLAVRDGSDAATAYANQDRDMTTFSYPIPESGFPIPEETFRQGRVVIYPPSLKITGNLVGFLVAWLLATVVLAAVAKWIADAFRLRTVVAKAEL